MSGIFRGQNGGPSLYPPYPPISSLCLRFLGTGIPGSNDLGYPDWKSTFHLVLKLCFDLAERVTSRDGFWNLLKFLDLSKLLYWFLLLLGFVKIDTWISLIFMWICTINFQAPLLVFDIVFFVLCGNVKHFYFHCRSLCISIVYRFVFPLCIALYVLSAISRIHCRIHSKSFRLFTEKSWTF